MIVALGYPQDIARQIFIDHIPRCILMLRKPTDAEALALSNSVVHQTLMNAQCFAFKIVNFSGLRRQILLKKVFKTSLTDKTDAG